MRLLNRIDMRILPIMISLSYPILTYPKKSGGPSPTIIGSRLLWGPPGSLLL